MEFFRRARNIWIRGGRFVQAHQYVEGFGPFALGIILLIVCGGFGYVTSTLSTVKVKLSGENAAQLLKDYAVAGATHNSGDRYDPPKCHEDTRTAFLADIRNEIAKSFTNTKLPPVLWIHGPAGIGKSAVAQTLAEGWEKDNQLAASFFFWRASPGRNRKTFVISTIAYQLSKTFPDMRPHIETAITEDPLFINMSLSAQADMLITTPLENSYSLLKGGARHTKVIVLDGLDEVLDEAGQPDGAGQRDILQVFINIVKKRSLPLRLLVLSRPELVIRETFDGFRNDLISRWNMTHLDHDRDIRTFLSSEFKSIRPWLKPPNWPPPEAISILTWRSSGKFIYPVVAMRYIEGHANPEEALQEVLSLETPGGDQHSPYSTLDVMYKHIFSSLHPSTLEFANILISTWIEGRWLGNGFAHLLTNYLAMNWDRSEWELQNLHSVVRRRDQNNDCEDCIRMQTLEPIHTSLLEFIQSPSRAGQFHLGTGLARSYTTFLLLLGLQNPHPVNHYPRYGDWHLFMEIKDRLRKGAEPLPLLRNCLANAHFEDVRRYTDRKPNRFRSSAKLEQPNMRSFVMSYLKDCQQKITPPPPISGRTENTKEGIRSLTDTQQEMLASLDARERKCIIGRPIIRVEQPEVDRCWVPSPDLVVPSPEIPTTAVPPPRSPYQQ